LIVWGGGGSSRKAAGSCTKQPRLSVGTECMQNERNFLGVNVDARTLGDLLVSLKNAVDL
jgi:hypothetical protein